MRNILKMMRKDDAGFSLTELMVAVLLASILTVAAYNFFKKSERRYQVEKLTGDVQSLSRVAFFLIGRDIRRAGSNPSQAVPQALSGHAAVPLAIPIAEPEKIEIRADLNGDGDSLDTDEDITYQYEDSNGDGVKDRIRRDPSLGDLIVIENVSYFRLSYVVSSGSELDYPGNPTSLVKKVHLQLKARSPRLDPNTQLPIEESFDTYIKLRNFQQ